MNRVYDLEPRQLQEILDAAVDEMIRVDQDWRIRFINQHALDVIKPSGRIIGKDYWLCFPWLVYEGSPWVEHLNRAMTHGVSADFETACPGPPPYRVRVYVRPTPEGIIVFSRELHPSDDLLLAPPKTLEDRQMEALESLERSNSMMRVLVSAVEHAEDVVLITEAEQRELPGPRILYVNEAFTRMTGYRPEEVLGQTPRILQGPKSDPAALERIHNALSAWQPVREELINYRKDGSEFHVELSIVPIADERGWYTHFAAIQRETTEQHRVRARLQESENRLRTLTEAIPQLLWTADSKGQCEYVSQSCAEFLGVSPKDCVGDGWSKFIHPDDREAVAVKWTDAITHGRTFVAEYRLRRHDGHWLWFLHRAAPRLNADGKLLEWVGTSTDIVVQKYSEEALRQAEKLMAVGRLASSISHEINNPLEALTNLLFLLGSSFELEAGAKELLQTAQEQLARVAEVTTQTLRFHKQSTGPSEVVLWELLDSRLTSHLTRLEQRDIQLRRDYARELILRCFAEDVRQALGNLIHNAVDALGDGGILWLRVRAACDPARRERRGTRITIADSGVGIPESDRDRLFHAFFTTKGVHGAGLGLWLTRNIVHRHEGAIHIRSSTRPGRSGTTVSIFLPFERENLANS